MSNLRALYRFIGFALYTIYWIVGCSLARWRAEDVLAAGIQWRQQWIKRMLPFLGLMIEVKGTDRLVSGPAIYVGNHRSYIDPVIAAKYAPGVAVAKSEVANWPLIGKGAKIAGVLFVKRENKDSRSSTLQAIEQLLKQGYSILVFPEGTTTKAPDFLPFRPGAFKLAAEHSIPVVPMAIEYQDREDAWIDDDTFLRHFFQTFGKLKIFIRMSIGPAMTNNDHLTLMNNVHDWIETELASLETWVQGKS